MRVNEIFYSLQGEGYFTGTPSVFIRLSGCNMQCDFCDTDHQAYTDMTEEEIVNKATAYQGNHVVITGGEPLIQLTASLVDRLHEAGKFVQIETNGTIAPDDSLVQRIDWVTCSPKYGHRPVIRQINELKVIFDINRLPDIDKLNGVVANHYRLQPCDRNNTDYNRRNLNACIDYILGHPKWCLSLQTHKLLNIK